MTNQTESATEVSFPSTEIEESNTAPIKDLERLKKIKGSQSQLTKIQKDLETLIDAMVQNPSILSRAANYWGNLPLWQKIVAGVILTAPPLIIGILAQLIVCFVVTAFFLATYIGTSVVLDDHYTHTKYSTTNIKSGVTNLAEGLDIVMKSLEQISEELSAQIAIFSKENEKFGDNVESLKLRNISLAGEVEKLRETEKKLRQTQIELENACTALKKSVGEQSTLLDQTQTALNKVKIDYQRNQKDLEEKTNQLSELQKQFQSEVTRYEQSLEALQTAVNELAENLVKDPQQQAAFLKKIDDFIKDKDGNFLKIFDGFTTTEKELAALKEQYKKQIAEHEQLVAQTATQVSHLERMGNASLLNAHGLYAPSSIVDHHDSSLRIQPLM